jgi:hypothetical protein
VAVSNDEDICEYVVHLAGTEILVRGIDHAWDLFSGELQLLVFWFANSIRLIKLLATETTIT